VNGRLALGALTIFALGCDGIVTDNLKDDWPIKHQIVVLPGFVRFTPLDLSLDVGVDVFSYVLPSRPSADEVFARVASQLGREPCFKVSTRSANEVHFRCARSPGAPWFEEYAMAYRATDGRVTVMWGNFDSNVEVSQQYEFFASSFRHWASKE